MTPSPVRTRRPAALLTSFVLSALAALTLVPATATAAPPTSVTTWWVPDTTTVALGTPATFNFTVPVDPSAATPRVVVDYFVDGAWAASATIDAQGRPDALPLATDSIGTSTHTFTFSTDRSLEPFLTAERTLTVFGEPTSVSTKWPVKPSIRLGGSAVVRGRVIGGLPRDVHLQFQGPLGWETLSTTTANLTGAYALSLPTSWYTSQRLRVHVPATGSHDAVDAAKGFTFAVTPSYKPQGSKKAYSLFGDRWDPCKTITYKVNPVGMPKGVRTKTIRDAISLIGDATGMTFAYVGRTTMLPYTSKTERVYGANIAIGFASHKQVPRLKGDVVGLGGPTALGRVSADGKGEYIEGQVVFDTNAKLKPGFGAGFTWGELIMHEVGHVVGLQHAMKPYQVMSYNTLAVDRFGAGDLAGLQRLGRSAGCFVGEDAAHRTNAHAKTARPRPTLPPIEPLRADEHGLLGHVHEDEDDGQH